MNQQLTTTHNHILNLTVLSIPYESLLDIKSYSSWARVGSSCHLSTSLTIAVIKSSGAPRGLGGLWNRPIQWQTRHPRAHWMLGWCFVSLVEFNLWILYGFVGLWWEFQNHLWSLFDHSFFMFFHPTVLAVATGVGLEGRFGSARFRVESRAHLVWNWYQNRHICTFCTIPSVEQKKLSRV